MDKNQNKEASRRRFLGGTLAATGAVAGGIAVNLFDRSASKAKLKSALSGQLFEDPTFDFQTRIMLGSSYYGCGNPGKLSVILSQIEDGNPESAFQAFFKAGLEARQWANEALEKQHLESARQALLWAANYLYTSLYFLEGSRDVARLLPTWQSYAACWSKAASLFTPAIERLEIPYEGTTITGWFFRVDDSRKKRPLVILNNGADGSELDMYFAGAAGGLARGYNCLTFNGPGQGDALWLKKLHFRPDWEKVIGPVVDFASAHPEVDRSRIALVGISQGGYFVPRALAFERRIRAGVADPGVWDIGEVATRQMPGQMVALLEAGKKKQFDEEIGFALKFQSRVKDMLQFRMRPYGVDSYFDFMRSLQTYSLKGLASQIQCPMLVTNPESEQFFVGQPKMVFEALRCPKTLLDFASAEGAAIHCELNSPGYRDFRIYNWLDETMA